MATSPNIKCEITEWGLPPLVVSWFKKKGISSLFEWQVECLCKNDVLFGGNLVYSAPTSAGKTLVGDFLLLKKVLEYGKKAMVIEPFVALTREKAATLKSMLFTTKARVGAFGGTYYTPGGLTAVSVAVCTIEKANNFINKLIGENKLSDLGIIVVDEIHYLGDERRGHQLELLLTKVMYYNSQQDVKKRIQIVGLSATIPNLESIAVWLNASLYVTTYRPVPLVEKIKIDNMIYEVDAFIKNPNCEPLEIIRPEKINIQKDFDDLCYICVDSIVNGYSTLVFCESKRECEIMASNLADQIKLLGGRINSKNIVQKDVSKRLREVISKPKIVDLLDKLKKCPAGPDKELVRSLSYGVGFHHAGLTSEEREIIEDGFKCGAIKTLMATSTLSSGVNLPARKVVIRSPFMISSNSSVYSKEMLNPITYRQMIGRAGRKGIDTFGESILICQGDNREVAMNLIKASLGNINSSLAQRMIESECGEPSGLKKAVLEAIANNTAKTRINLNKYLNSTFWLTDTSTSKKEQDAFISAITKTLRFLTTKKFIEELKPGHYRSTRLGNAVLASGLHPDESLELLQDLVKARQGFCLLNDLHIIYQVTPNDIARTVDLKDWHHYSKIWNDLDETSQYVGERVGIDEVIIARRCQGFMASLGDEKERIFKRFWIALVINDLISEMQLHEICKKYRIAKAKVQQAQRAVAQFAGVISIFCQGLGYDNIAALVTPLESRINFSCQRDLLDLIRLNITRPIARSLYNAGYTNVIAVAKGDKLDIEFIVRQIKPFRKDSSFNSDSTGPPSMWVPELAKTMSTLDYASHIVDTARNFVEIEYDIQLGTESKRKGDDSAINSADDSLTNIDKQPEQIKRTRHDDGIELESYISSDIDSYESDDNMGRARKKNLPNFVVEYIGQGIQDSNEFLSKWISHSSISLNFKIVQQVNKPIGANIKGLRRRSDRHEGHKKLRKTLEQHDPSDSFDHDYASDDSDDESQDGLTLQLDIDNKKHILTHLYACFDDDLTVYVVDNYRGLRHIKNNLKNLLKVDQRTSNDQAAATSSKETSNRIKLFTQNIVTTYKILYAALGVDQVTLNNRFEWHAFDVSWWLISNCPNRGVNNRNSSLSLMAKTRWAAKFRHFLHPNLKRSTSRGGNDHDNYQKVKDIVKAGKTAILKPLITEFLLELAKRHQLIPYCKVEIPSRLVMAQMMIHGIGLNLKSINKELTMYEDLSHQLTDIAQRYYAKSSISLNNIRHVAHVLYEDLDLKHHLLDHSINSNISKDPTNAEVLNILSRYHPFPRMVQDFRKIAKASEALQSVNTYARFNDELNMVRVFGQCDFWQQTGRVSMFEPDLFTINRNFTVVLPAHNNREEETIECAPRDCFLPVKEWIFVAADYSQLELRLLAHFSNDENLLQILNRSLESDESYDVFKTVAANINKKPIDKVTTDDRQHAKKICYGIIYGMGNRSLANQLGLDLEMAETFRQDFFNAFPEIQIFTDNSIERCEELGYVESLLGRRRTVEGINSDNSSARSRARRVAVNTKIQSSASDIIKLAMQLMQQKILSNFHGKARLVLEMHDELIYEICPSILTEFSKVLKSTMESLSESENLKVKLLVNLKKGTSWSNLDNFKLESP